MGLIPYQQRNTQLEHPHMPPPPPRATGAHPNLGPCSPLACPANRSPSRCAPSAHAQQTAPQSAPTAPAASPTRAAPPAARLAAMRAGLGVAATAWGEGELSKREAKEKTRRRPGGGEDKRGQGASEDKGRAQLTLLLPHAKHTRCKAVHAAHRTGELAGLQLPYLLPRRQQRAPLPLPPLRHPAASPRQPAWLRLE